MSIIEAYLAKGYNSLIYTAEQHTVVTWKNKSYLNFHVKMVLESIVSWTYSHKTEFSTKNFIYMLFLN